jgi:hypothetical protein
MEKGLKVNIVTYNNKFRKGDYIVINKDRRTRTYKYKDEYPLDYYLEIAKQSWGATEKTKGAKPSKRKILKELDAVSRGQESNLLKRLGMNYDKYKGKKVDEYFKKGRSEIRIPFENLKENPRPVYEKLLRPLVLDEELLQILIQNAEKFKHRFWYYTEINGMSVADMNEGRGKIAKISNCEFAGRTPMQFIHEHKGYFDKNRVTSRAILKPHFSSTGGIKPELFIDSESYWITQTMISVVFKKGEIL